MNGVNKVIILGTLGRDPETRYAQSGTAFCNFSVATSEQWTDKQSGERKEQTEWHNIVAMGKQAELCQQYLHKGDKAYIEGKLRTSNWEKDGQKHYRTEVVLQNVQFLSSKREEPKTTEIFDEDIPF